MSESGGISLIFFILHPTTILSVCFLPEPRAFKPSLTQLFTIGTDSIHFCSSPYFAPLPATLLTEYRIQKLNCQG